MRFKGKSVVITRIENGWIVKSIINGDEHTVMFDDLRDAVNHILEYYEEMT